MDNGHFVKLKFFFCIFHHTSEYSVDKNLNLTIIRFHTHTHKQYMYS